MIIHRNLRSISELFRHQAISNFRNLKLNKKNSPSISFRRFPFPIFNSSRFLRLNISFFHLQPIYPCKGNDFIRIDCSKTEINDKSGNVAGNSHLAKKKKKRRKEKKEKKKRKMQFLLLFYRLQPAGN